jgi:cytochrome c-type biogenesis protein CcmE
MSARLFRLLDGINRRRALTSWLVAVTAAVAVTCGLLIGAGRQPADAAGLPAEATLIEGAVATVAPRTASVSGVVVAVREHSFGLRTADGRILLVRTDQRTRYRRSGDAIPHEQLRRGQRVTVLGRTQENGRFHARAVAVRGEVRQLPPTGKPSPAATPTTTSVQ